MSVCIVGTHKMLGQAASLAFQIQGVEVVGAGPEICGPSPRALAEFDSRLLRVPRLTHIIYCAADFDPDRCEREPDNPRYLSAELPPLLAAIALRLDARFISVGTHYIFSGNLLSRGYAESRSCHPVNHLGRCQLEGEKAQLAVNPEAFVLRTCWVYGDEEFGPFANLLRGIIRASFSGGDLPLVNDEVASPTWARNVADALVGMTYCEKGYRSLHPRQGTELLAAVGWDLPLC